MNRPDVPVDRPLLSSMDDAAVGLHEICMSYVRAGFTRDEALKLTMQQLKFAHECPNHKPDE